MVPVAPQPAPVQYSGRPTGPNGQPTGPAKPLFPAASGAPSSVAGPVGADFKPLSAGARPTFPAYSGERNGSDGEGGEKKPALIATTGSNSRIIHPPEDISLVSVFKMVLLGLIFLLLTFGSFLGGKEGRHAEVQLR